MALSRPRTVLSLALAIGALAGRARAETADAREPDRAARLLGEHLALLAARRLTPPPAESVAELDELLEQAHRYASNGRKDEATMLLLEAVEGQRFRSFEALDSYAAAELMLASLLLEQHALSSADRGLARLLARGPNTPSFGPAYRRAVDVALARGDYARSADALSARVKEPLPEDAANELRYLRALAARDAGDAAASGRALQGITSNSRFYGSARYLLGALAAERAEYDDAEKHFCAARDVAKGATRSRYESWRLAPTEDVAQLGLARVAHERGRSQQAFDHYFRVPNDSPVLAEALFEAAYASYERGHDATALDSLAQLEARYPHSPYTAEARVLRGYVHLARCDFERAERELLGFEQAFGALLGEIDATLASPSRLQQLFAQRADAEDPLLAGLLVRDPEVERLRQQLAALDAELARSAGVGTSLAALAERLRGGEVPRARVSEENDNEHARASALRAGLGQARDALSGLRRELRALRAAGAKGAELAALVRGEQALTRRVDALEASLRALVRRREHRREAPAGAALAERLERDRAYVQGVHSRAARLRDDLEGALVAAERRALERLRARLQKELRRARIGRIDAVMGKQRKLELEIESLAAGRFPPELTGARPRRPALLADDEEYWPFEGEDWPDEFQERKR